MSTLSEIQHLLAPQLKRLNDTIAQSLLSQNELMNQIVDNYLQKKGKQIRPILVMLSARLFGEINDTVIDSAASVELLHNASLIHDDVVDETKQRRGVATVNGVWDNHIAVLVGDFFVSTSLSRILRTADRRAIEALASLGRQLSIGEIDQICCARDHKLDEDAYFTTIGKKTASLFVTCVKLGGYAVGAPDDGIATVAEFARLLGLCFQIRDDIFDYYADDKIGKPTGNDLREGKITLPLLHVLTNPSLPAHDEMIALSQKEVLTCDEINRLIEYAKDNGGIDYAYQRMEQLRDRAVKLIASLGDSEPTRLLCRLFDFTIDRAL